MKHVYHYVTDTEIHEFTHLKEMVDIYNPKDVELGKAKLFKNYKRYFPDNKKDFSGFPALICEVFENKNFKFLEDGEIIQNKWKYIRKTSHKYIRPYIPFTAFDTVFHRESLLPNLWKQGIIDLKDDFTLYMVGITSPLEDNETLHNVSKLCGAKHQYIFHLTTKDNVVHSFGVLNVIMYMTEDDTPIGYIVDKFNSTEDNYDNDSCDIAKWEEKLRELF